MRRATSFARQTLFFTLMLAGAAIDAPAQTGTEPVTPGALLTYSTIYSIGLEWDVVNDSDHDATATIEYRVAGESVWKPAGSLLRVDFNGRSMLAGSVLFLTPNTEYQLRLALSDPDGGVETRTATVRTRPVPATPAGRTFHVMPGAGGGDGSPQAPFGGIAAAQNVAQPGDTFLLHAGSYGGRIRLSRAGTTAAYIVWKAIGDGEVFIDGIDVGASHIWLEGLTIRNQTSGVLTANAPQNVVVTRCRFVNNLNAILLSSGGSGWYIADNTIVGITPHDSGSFNGEGIDLNITNNHTVAHNSITKVADGISYPRLNVDIFGNDVFDTADDGIELDFGLSNVRVWGNRIHNAVHNGLSFQPQSGAPWYILRNQIVGSVEAAFKFRTTDRFVLLHNTIVHWGNAWPGTSMMCCNEDHLLRAFARNNLWISVQGGQIWGFEAAARDWWSDLDYDGIDWGSATDPFTYEGMTFPDLFSFAAASGLERNGIRVFKDGCFEDFQVPGPSPTPIPPHVMTLRSGCGAIDAGAILPGLNDGFLGLAPDIGAHEFGGSPTRYGPRPTLAVPAAPASLTATAVSSTRIDLQWTDSSNTETGFQIERSTDGQTFAAIGSGAADTATFSDTTVAAGTRYFYRVAAFNGAGLSPYSNVASAMTNPPAGSWSSGDIGSVGEAGSASESNGTWTVRASGADIWGTADAFHFVRQPLTGDGAIVARVANIQNVNVWTKAGVMIRETLAAGSRHAFMLATPGGTKGLGFQRRVTPGGISTHTGASGTAPVWVKLERVGTTFSGYYSADGATWIRLGTETIQMAATVHIGLALTSHDNTQLATATFDNVSVTAGPPAAGPWKNNDIGATGLPGGASESTGTWTVRASGADIWSTADAFHFVHQPMTGDGVIVARVASIQNVHVWTKAGVMIRETLAANSKHAFMLATPGGTKGLGFQRRLTTGGDSIHTGAPGTAPVWLKLERTGATFAGYYSADGVSWALVGTDTVPMAATVYVGLALTSHDNSQLATATFDHVSIGPTWTSHDVGAVSAAGSSSASADGTSFSVSGSGSDIWDTADEFRYTYRVITGDFEISARVSSVEFVHQWTKAGLMIRASAAANSVHASVFATPSTTKGTAFQRRMSTGAISLHTAGPMLAPPIWLKLTRQGQTVVASYRLSTTDTWTVIGQEVVSNLPNTLLVGMAVTAHADGELATATFEEVQIAAIQ
jgi:regulation of enolase protein 1 (concanavalin A-like superfamily)